MRQQRHGSIAANALSSCLSRSNTTRCQRVMLDSVLAEIYGVSTKRLNEQLKRNRKRFPADFAFQLTAQEFMNLKSQFATSSSDLRSQIATSSAHGGKRKAPWVFTEH